MGRMSFLTSTAQNKTLVVLITGASTGLGLAIARAFQKYPVHLILTARQGSLKRFEQTEFSTNEHCWIEPLDITKAQEREQLIEKVNSQLGGVDVLINNAGKSYRAVVEHITEKERISQMDINFRAPMEMVRLCLPSMREKMFGHIINISSVSGMLSMPTMAVYCASKRALEGASESLWYEVKPWNIRVSIVQPGFINSEGINNILHTELSYKSKSDPNDPYFAHYIYMDSFIRKMMQGTIATSDSVARKVVKVAFSKNPPLRVPATWDAYFFYFFQRFCPRRLFHWILYQSLPKIHNWGPNSMFSKQHHESN